MSEQFDTDAEQYPRILRLHTDDGPVVELEIAVTPDAVKGRLRIWDVPTSPPPLTDLSTCVLREEISARDKLAQWWAGARTDQQLYAAMQNVYDSRATRWNRAQTAGTAAANAAAATVPEVDLATLTATYRRATLMALP